MKISKIVYYGSQLVLNRVLSCLPLKKNRVLFLSDVRKELTGNFEFVSKALPEKYEIVTSLKGDRRERHSFGDYLKQCYYLATCGYIMLDDYSEATAFIRVRKNQQLVQLWHSSGAFKKFAHSRSGESGDIKRIHPGYKRYTKAITSSPKINHCFEDAFHISADKVVATGIPRIDVFFDEEYKAKIVEEFYSEYEELRGKKLVLFAPTYRGTKVSDADYDFAMLDLEYMQKTLGDDYAVLIKWHPALYNNICYGLAEGVDIKPFEGFAYDFSQYREVNNLLFVTDVLVTDYSSLIFDYALLRKPCVHYIFDVEDYEGGRGLYYPFEKYIYGQTCKNKEELCKAILDEKVEEEKLDQFIDEFVSRNDGQATRRVIENIFV